MTNFRIKPELFNLFGYEMLNHFQQNKKKIMNSLLEYLQFLYINIYIFLKFDTYDYEIVFDEH